MEKNKIRIVLTLLLTMRISHSLFVPLQHTDDRTLSN